MNKYELCVVLSAKLEDDERAAAIEKIKEYVTRFGGAVGENIQEWGKKRLAYEIQHMKEGFYYFIPFTGIPRLRTSSRASFVLWNQLSDILLLSQKLRLKHQ